MLVRSALKVVGHISFWSMGHIGTIHTLIDMKLKLSIVLQTAHHTKNCYIVGGSGARGSI